MGEEGMAVRALVWDHERGLVVDARTGEVLAVLVDERPPFKSVHGWQRFEDPHLKRVRGRRSGMVVVSLKLPRWMLERLDEEAVRRGETRSSLIRSGIMLVLRGELPC